MKARGAALALLLAALVAMVWVMRPSDHSTRTQTALPAGVAERDAPLPSPRFAAGEPRATSAARSIASATWSLRPIPASGTPSVGVAAVLHQPRFSPRIDIEAEVWAAFVASPGGDPSARWSSVADRLARLGLACEHTRAWSGGGIDLPRGAKDGEVRLAVIVTAASIGALRLSAGERALPMTIWGTAEVDVALGGEAWGWSASCFPGPHRLRPGAEVPAAELRAVVVTTRELLTVAFADPLHLVAGTRSVACFAPARRVRVLPQRGGPLLLRCRAPGWGVVEIAISTGPWPTAVVELGRPFGDYGNPLGVPHPAASRTVGGW